MFEGSLKTADEGILVIKVAHIAPSRKSRASAAWRIVTAQQAIGIEAFSLVMIDPQGPGTETVYKRNWLNIVVLRFSRIVGSIAKKILYKPKTQNDLPWSLDISTNGLARTITRLSPDIVHLHWIPALVDLESIARLNVPVFITLHDVWPLTGGCHCNLDCNQWEQGCSACPQMFSRFEKIYSPNVQWQKQLDCFAAIKNLTIVCPSEWIFEMATRSPKFRQSSVVKIQNCVNEKAALSLEPQPLHIESFEIAFVLSGQRNSYHKGLDLVLQVLKIVDSKKHTKPISVNFIGMELPQISLKNVTLRSTPHLNSEERIFEELSFSDLVLLPSRQDNLPNVAIEANLVGTPVIAFEVGGVGEIVIDAITGFVIKPFDCDAFAQKIIDYVDGIITLPSRDQIRKLTEFTFGSDLVAKKHLESYKAALKVPNV